MTDLNKADIEREAAEQTLDRTSMNAVISHSHRPPDVDLRSIAWALVRGKWTILLAVVICVVYAGYSLTHFVPQYRAGLIVASLTSGNSLRLPSSLGQLAAGVGVSIPQESSTKFDRFKVVLGTVELARRLDEKYGYVKTIYDGSWDRVTGEPIPPTHFQSKVDGFFRQFFRIPEWTEPTVQSLATYIGSSIQVNTTATNTPIYTIEYVFPDREFALQFLSNVYSEAENLLRESEEQQVAVQLNYLSEKLQQTAIADYKGSLLLLIGEQEKRMMTLNPELPYLGEVIQYPSVTDTATRPSVILRLLMGLVFGVVIGSIVVILYRILRFVFARRVPTE